jgi:hypothetical protein
MSDQIIYRGYDIEHVNGCWIIRRDGKELHRATGKSDAVAWINAERTKQIKNEKVEEVK